MTTSFSMLAAHLSRDMFREIELLCTYNYGDPDVIYASQTQAVDFNAQMNPFGRGGITDGGNVNPDYNSYRFQSDHGGNVIKIYGDTGLRPNRPLAYDGVYASGKPRSADDATLSGKLSLTAATLLPSGHLTAISAGSGYFYNFASRRGVANPVAPAVPSGTVSGRGNNGNNLAAGRYYYAVSAVLNGFETAPIYCDDNSNDTGSVDIADQIANAAVTVTAGQVVRVIITHAGVGGTAATKCSFRIYRTKALAGSAVPASILDYDLVGECGRSSDSTSVFYDNGFTIPGSDNAFVLTTNKRGKKNVMYAQLLPLKRKPLSPALQTTQFGYLMYGTPVTFVPRFNVWIRNLQRLS